MLCIHNAAIAITMSLAGTALGGNVNDWIATVGDWTNPANWSMGSVPTPEQTTIIANGGVAIIDHQDLTLGQGLIGTTLDGRFGMGEVIQRGGSTNWSGFGTLLLGRDEGSSGALTLTDQGQLTAFGALEIGWRGHAEAYINDGSVVDVDQLIVGGRRYEPERSFSATASLEVMGPGTLIRTDVNPNANGMVIGAGGTAQVTIRDGARIETSNALLLSTTAQGSSLTIDGPGSMLQVFGDFFDTGRDIDLPDDHPPVGNAVLTLRNGGTLDARQTSRAMVFNSDTLVNGSGEILGDITNFEGSVFDPGEGDQYGLLIVSGQIDNTVSYIQAQDGGTLHFDVGGINSFDQLMVGELVAGGTLEIAIADDFSAQFGQSFDIINTDSLSGSFTKILLPELEGSLYFDADVHGHGVTLRVVPTPASLLVLSIPMLARVRRRA
ncbi:MAG: hypothetical protein KDA29_10400 [Phycisphaerales bacterium]|nr:hypothetical protein [Phycisphaerales bacterium]